MNAPPNQPPGGKPVRFDPMTGQPIHEPPVQQPVAYQQPAPQPIAYQQPAPQPVFVQPQPQARIVQQPMPGVPAQPAPGYMPPQGQMPCPMAPKKDETMALVALLLGVGAWVVQLHFLLAIPAIIVGFMARKKIKADPEKFGGDGLAKAGIIVGFVNLGLWILIGIVTVLAFLVPFCIACVGVGAGALNS